MFDVQPFHLVVIISRMPIDEKVVRDLLHGAADVSIQLLNCRRLNELCLLLILNSSLLLGVVFIVKVDRALVSTFRPNVWLHCLLFPVLRWIVLSGLIIDVVALKLLF